MSSLVFSVLFVGFLAVTLIVRFWLGSRHIRHVIAHRNAVPAEFAEKIPLYAHQKAADYTVAKTKLSLLALLVNSAVLIGFTLLGGLQWLSVSLFQLTGAGMTYQLILLAAFAFISAIVELPFDYYKQFVL
jgi:STE24 endopeptidase